MDLKKICRACLTNEEDLYDIFKNATTDMYMYCTSIQVCKEDQLPKTICQYCYEYLHKFYIFKQKCLKSEEKLHQYIGSNLGQSEIKYDSNTVNFPPNICAVKIETHPDIPINSSPKREEKKNFDIKANSDESASLIKKQIQVCYDDEDQSDNGNSAGDISPTSDNPLDSEGASIDKKELKRKIAKYSCKVCKRKFTYRKRLEAHKLKAHTVAQNIVCLTCNKKFKQWDGLKRHRLNVHATSWKSLECTTCGKHFKSAITLRNHEKIIHGERQKFVCHICGGSFRSSTGLEHHVDTHRENREKNFVCQICNKKFLTHNYLTTHMFRHRERRFVCTECRFPFFTRTDLSRHMLIHKGIKPFVCEVCNKGYSTKSFLTEHGRTHSGERPFNCDYCAMNFISKRRLVDHRRTHTGEKPHKCDKCNQAFIQRGSLTRHLKVHEK